MNRPAISTFSKPQNSTEFDAENAPNSNAQIAPTRKPTRKRFAFEASRFYAPMLAFLCFAMAWRALNPDDDFWAHAAVGRWIWNHKMAPHSSLFLWGSEPIPWIAHSWLTQLCFYFLLQLGGGWTARGDVSIGHGPLVAVVFTVAMVGAVFALLWRLWRENSRPNGAALLLFALTLYAGSLRYRTRPELFSALFLTVLLGFLVRRHNAENASANAENAQSESSQIEYSKSAERGNFAWTRHEIGLILLFALWANFHGAVLIGVVLLWLTAIGDALQNRFAPRVLRFFALSLACTLATALVPFRALQYWGSILDSTHGITFSRILEWQPPLSAKEMTRFVTGGDAPGLLPFMLAESALFLCALLALTANAKRRAAYFAWLFFMGAMLLRQRRHFWIFAIVCLAVLAANAAFFETKTLWHRWNSRTILRRKTAVSSAKNSSRLDALANLESSTAPPDEVDFSDDKASNSAQNTRPEFAPPNAQASQEKSREANAPDFGNASLEASPKVRFFWQIAALCVVFGAAISVLPRDSLPMKATSNRLPDKACRVLEMRAQARNRPFHLLGDYENSSYLQWRLNGENARGVVPNRGLQPLYIDLLNAYPDALLLQYLDIMAAKTRGQNFLKQRDVDCVILNPKLRDGKLAKFLDHDARWTHLYRDRAADIWIRRDVANRNSPNAKSER